MNEKVYYNAHGVMPRSRTSTLSIRNTFSLFLGILFVVLIVSECAWEHYGCVWPGNTVVAVAQDVLVGSR